MKKGITACFAKVAREKPQTTYDNGLRDFGPDLIAGIRRNTFYSRCSTPNPEEAVLQNHSDTEVRRALETLPPIFREVLILRELEGMSYREIADITGMPAGTVMSSLSRGRNRLRQLLAVENSSAIGSPKK